MLKKWEVCKKTPKKQKTKKTFPQIASLLIEN